MKNNKSIIKENIEESFYLLKTEAYLFKKKNYIDQRIKESGLVITEKWKVRLTFSDIFQLYENWIPWITTIMRMPPLFKLDICFLKGRDAINLMYQLKHQIRKEIWGREFKKGGFLHTPDSIEEACRHKLIIAKRKIQ